MNNRGFTLVELIIVVAILGIVGAIVFDATSGMSMSGHLSFGFNGTVEMRCVGGYEVLVDERGYTQQMLDENGRAVKCDR